jgi:L-ribulose-5-phosphate 4-epimerase
LDWGNVSGIDRTRGLMVIKPGEIAFEELSPEDMTVVDMAGIVVEGYYKPSADMLTHLRLYQAFEEIEGIAHTHAAWGTAFAQAGHWIPAYGATHADFFHGAVPCTRELSDGEVFGEYEQETGNAIVEAFCGIDPLAVPAALVYRHGAYAWGVSPADAVKNAYALEEVAKIAAYTRMLSPELPQASQALLDKHYLMKRGANNMENIEE